MPPRDSDEENDSSGDDGDDTPKAGPKAATLGGGDGDDGDDDVILETHRFHADVSVDVLFIPLCPCDHRPRQVRLCRERMS